MAIGRINGSMLNSNLLRGNVDLAIDTNLIYANVTARRVGINTASPAYSLDVSGNARIGSVILDTNLVNLGPISSVKITGGFANGIIITDGTGNLSFGNVGSVVSAHQIPLGVNTIGSLTSAVNLANLSVTDSLASLNQFIGNISSIAGSPTGILYATNLYGTISTNVQPHINTLSNVTIDKVYTANLFAPNGASLISTTIASDPTIVGINANVVTANNAVVSYVNALNTAMAATVSAANAAVISNVAVLNANIAGANAAIVTANAYAVSYADSLNAAMVANVTAANLTIIQNYSATQLLQTEISGANAAIIANVALVNAAMIANVSAANAAVIANVAVLNANIAGANAAIVTANTYAKNYADQLNAVMISNIQAVDSAYNFLNANVGAFQTYANTTFIAGKVGSVIAGNANATITVDTFNSHQYSTIKYLLQATHNGDVHSLDLLVITNGTTVIGTQYSALTTSSSPLITSNATISTGNVSVSVIPTYANTTIDFTRIQVISRV